jgi:hypothetical protein
MTCTPPVLQLALAFTCALPLAFVPAASAQPALTQAAAASPALLGCPAPCTLAPTVGLDEVARGQRGYGLSVFAGDRPERFEVEVLGVLRNLAPDSSFILARLSGPGVDLGGVSAGMSGSPVYLDGRLAGAVAFSWPYAKEAIAGITPIADMRALAVPRSGTAVGSAGRGTPSLSWAALVRQELPAGLLERHLARLRPATTRGATGSLLWSSAGFGPRTEGLLAATLGGLGQVAAAAPLAGASPAPQPGEMIGVVVLDGDLRMAAMGTVTDRFGETVLAFGHHFLDAGGIRLPMARGEVITVLASVESSFKVTNLGEIVGAFELDHRPGIVGRLGASAPMVPVAIRLRGDREKDLAVRAALSRELTPSMIATAVLGALENHFQGSGPQTVDLELRLELAGHAPLAVRQSFDGEGVGLNAAGYTLSLVDAVLANRFAEVALENVAIGLVARAGDRLARVIDAHADRTRVKPGDVIRLHVDLEPFRGPRLRRSLDVQVPEDVAPGRYILVVGDGVTLDTARLQVEPTEPANLAELLAALGKLGSRRELAVLGLTNRPGLEVSGKALPQLPGSARQLLSGSAASARPQEPSITALRQAIVYQHRQTLDLPITGSTRVELTILGEAEEAAAEPEAANGARPGFRRNRGSGT